MSQTWIENGWKVESNSVSHILDSNRMEEYERELSICTLPEMIFGDNKVSFHHEASSFTLEFNCYDAIKDAKHKEGEERDPLVKYAGEWQNKEHKAVADPSKPTDQGVRWTYQTDYMGSMFYTNDASKQVQVEATTQDIDYEMLKDTSQPILCSDNVVLYEDELHDCGESKCQVRYRVMPNCFFILHRSWVRVDEVVSKLKDTRIFHKFGTDCIIREVCHKELPLKKVPSCDQVDIPFQKYDNPDTHQHLMATTSTTLERIIL